MVVRIRDLTEEETEEIKRLAHSRTAPARLVERARMVWLANCGQRTAVSAAELHVHVETARQWLKRVNALGLNGLHEAPRAGRPATYTYTPEPVGAVIGAALTDPQRRGLPLGCWTLDRLAVSLNEALDVPIERSRIDELLITEGLRWRSQETWFGERAVRDPASDQRPAPIKKEREGAPDVAQKGGHHAPRDDASARPYDGVPGPAGARVGQARPRPTGGAGSARPHRPSHR